MVAVDLLVQDVLLLGFRLNADLSNASLSMSYDFYRDLRGISY